jgi:hypothetical protein
VENLIRGSDSTITTSSMDKHCGTFSPKAVDKPCGMAGIIPTIGFPSRTNYIVGIYIRFSQYNGI